MDDTGLQCSFSIEGARWRTDLLTPYKTGAPVSSLCLQSTQHDLPAGDRAATLVLSLLRDRQTAMRIPLLGQFIAADRALLRGIGMFTDEGPMPDFDEPDEFDFPPMDIEPEEFEFPLMKRSLQTRMNGPCSTSCTTHHERNRLWRQRLKHPNRSTAHAGADFASCCGRGSGSGPRTHR